MKNLKRNFVVIAFAFLICAAVFPQIMPFKRNTCAQISAVEEWTDDGEKPDGEEKATEKEKPDFIKWVDFKVPFGLLKACYSAELKYHGDQSVKFSFVQALAYLAAKNGNSFSHKNDIKRLESLIEQLKEKNTDIPSIMGENKYFNYYVEAYNAVFGENIGEYEEGGEVKYGLKTYFPLKTGYWYNHYDDFGRSRSYGFKRRHLGHDILGGIGTPILAVEDGTVEELGWNRYGGWRIGVRSLDKKRYYYYAHLRKDKPFAEGLEKGMTVKAGQNIGFLGVTGYSVKENVNMKGKPHLHFGLQLIFDESQYNSSSEIWIDVYSLSKFYQHCGRKG